jgi:N-acetylgalactosamine-N,N'-diacetylbacillosaminyl-diphospho-undecaprenol 4-alpha-N-acetylgalactosaminyltransferase
MNKNINLGIFINSLNRGGAERVVSILANELILNSNITIILLNDSINFQLDKRINIVNLIPNGNIFTKFAFLIFSPFYLHQILKINQINTLLVFLYKPAFLSVFTRMVFQWNGKIIISERTYTLAHYNPFSIKGKLGLFLIKYFYNKADLILPNSKLTGFALKEKLNINTPIKIIYNPIYLPEKLIFKDEFPKVVQILSVGNFFSYKNHELLIRSLEYLDFKNWHLNLIGNGPLRNYLMDLTKELNIQEKVSFLGSVDSKLFYSNSDIFVLPSLIEGFPNALVEAMSFGLPVISTDCRSGPREILCPNTDFRVQLLEDCDPEYGEFGILVPCSNFTVLSQALMRLLSERQLFKFYINQSLQRAKDFSHNKILKEFKLTINDTFHK